MENPLAQGTLLPGDFLRATWNLYRRHWPTWVILSVIAYLPFILVSQILNITYDGPLLPTWGILIPVTQYFMLLLMSGAGPIFLADGLSGERPSIWYALDLLVTQRLGRVLLMALLTGLIGEFVTYPASPSLLLNLLPYEQAAVLTNAIPWIAGIALLLIGLAILATRQQRSFPLFVVVVFIVVYSIVLINAGSGTLRYVQLFRQGARSVINALFLLVIPIVALDPGPLRKTAARGWRIAKANLPLIFAVLFIIGIATQLFDVLAQVAGNLLPALLPPGRTTFLGPWQVSTDYVSYIIYYIPLTLLIMGVLLPLQTIFATLVTLDGYRMFSDEEEYEDDEWDEDEEEFEGEDEDADESAETDVEEAAIEAADARLDALDLPDEAASAPIDEAEASDELHDLADTDDEAYEDDWEEEWEAEKAQQKAAKRAERVARREARLQAVAAQPLLTYRDLLSFAGLIIVGTGLTYLWSLGLSILVNWFNQLIV